MPLYRAHLPGLLDAVALECEVLPLAAFRTDAVRQQHIRCTAVARRTLPALARGHEAFSVPISRTSLQCSLRSEPRVRTDTELTLTRLVDGSAAGLTPAALSGEPYPPGSRLRRDGLPHAPQSTRPASPSKWAASERPAAAVANTHDSAVCAAARAHKTAHGGESTASGR
jgi:hypothetical protein